MAGGVKTETGPNLEARAKEAVSQGQFQDAARWFLEAHRPYDAAVCFQKANQPRECLDALLKVPSSSVPYRLAAVHAIRIGITLGANLQRLLTFLEPFLNTSPTSPAEAAAFKQVAAEMAKGEKKQQARAVYERILGAFPNDEEVKEALAALPQLREMTASPNRGKPFTDILIAKGLLPKAKLQALLQQQQSLVADEVALGDTLAVEGYVSELDVLQALSESTGLPYISAPRLLSTAEPEAVKRLLAEQAERWHVLPLALIDRVLHVAMRDPRDMKILDELRFAAGVKQAKGVFASELGIRKGIRKFYYGEEEDAGGAEDWRMWEQNQSNIGVSRFADRVTRTREQEFDTKEMQLRISRDARQDELMSPARELDPDEMSGEKPAPAPMSVSVTSPEADGEPVELPAGTIVDKRYKIESLLGKGGSAMVYRALDLELNEAIALKMFSLSSQNDALHARFKLELSLSRQLVHPNVIRLFDLGTFDRWRYLTIELLEGTDVGSLVAEKGPLPPLQGIILLEQAAAGLQAAHEKGVIHRDVKPRNLFVTRAGVVKVMDFGIAKKEHTPGVTVAGTIAGTPEYMSPEQINGFSSVNHLTDLYALGASAYEIFTGRPPFYDLPLVQLLLAQAAEEPVPPRQKNPAIPVELEDVILKLLQKKPQDRFQSAAEVGAALKNIRESLSAKR